MLFSLSLTSFTSLNLDFCTTWPVPHTSFACLLLLIFIGIWLLYNLVLVSAVKQSESVIHIDIHICICAQLLGHVWLCDFMDCSPPGSSVYGIFQARILEWVAIFSSRGFFPTQGLNLYLLHCQARSLPLSHQGSPQYVYIYMLLLLPSHFSSVWLCATPETAAHQAPPSLGFFRQEHWSGLSFPSPMHESEKWKWSRLVVSDS